MHASVVHSRNFLDLRRYCEQPVQGTCKHIATQIKGPWRSLVTELPFTTQNSMHSSYLSLFLQAWCVPSRLLLWPGTLEPLTHPVTWQICLDAQCLASTVADPLHLQEQLRSRARLLLLRQLKTQQPGQVMAQPPRKRKASLSRKGRQQAHSRLGHSLKCPSLLLSIGDLEGTPLTGISLR